MSIKDQTNIYLNFVVGALRGGNPSQTDAMLREYKKEIYGVAKLLNNSLGTCSKGDTLYRGVLLEDKYVINNTLLPLEYIEYMSFSQSKDSAGVFADVNSSMSEYFMRERPTAKGYMIEHIVSNPEDEVLFHYKWVNSLQLFHPIFQLDMQLIEEQKEVILKSNGMVYDLTQYGV